MSKYYGVCSMDTAEYIIKEFDSLDEAIDYSTGVFTSESAAEIFHNAIEQSEM